MYISLQQGGVETSIATLALNTVPNSSQHKSQEFGKDKGFRKFRKSDYISKKL